MAYLLIFMIVVLGYLILYRKDLQHPLVYFFGIWTVCLLFTLVDYYHVRIVISQLTGVVLALGILGFFIGTLTPSLFFQHTKFRHNLGALSEPVVQYRRMVNNVVLLVGFVFSAYLMFNTLKFIHSGYSYSSIRDLLFSYGASGQQYFSSTFFSTFYSWIASPFVYFLTTVAVLDVFEQKSSKIFILLIWLTIGMYTFATGGRLMVLLMLAEFLFALSFYRVTVPKKYIKRALFIAILLLMSVMILSTFRKKEEIALTTQSVNSIYAYFNINVPILSRWLDEVQVSNVFGYGEAFFNGIMQPIAFVTSKMGLSLPHYNEVASLLDLPQTRWLQVYDGHWYNAFSSLFYNFYIDFREPGVLIGSFAFGLITRTVQIQVSVLRQKRYLPLYLVLIQVMISSFARWQFGTVTFVVAAIVSILCTKKGTQSK